MKYAARAGPYRHLERPKEKLVFSLDLYLFFFPLHPALRGLGLSHQGTEE